MEAVIDEPRETFELVTSVAQNPPSPNVDDERSRIATQLLGHFKPIQRGTGWEVEEIARLLGCTDPNPRSWHHADPESLRRSVEVVRFMAEQMALCSERPTQTVSDLGAIAIAAVPAEAAMELTRRSSRRESLVLSIEVLSRLRGDVEQARLVLQTPAFGVTPNQLVVEDRLGSARVEVLRRLRPGFRRIDPTDVNERPESVDSRIDDTDLSGVRSGDQIREELRQLLDDLAS